MPWRPASECRLGLGEVVRYYAKGGTENPGLDPHVAPIDMTERDVADLVAFLESLTSERRPGLGPAARHRARQTRIWIVDLEGRPIPNLAITVRPFGDRLGDADPVRKPSVIRTDKNGWLKFRFPDWTHVVLSAHEYEIGESRPLPDFFAKGTLVATPLDRVSMRVIVPDGTPRPPDRFTARPTKGGPVVFERVRYLSRREALYVAKPGHAKAVVEAMVQPVPKGTVHGLRRIDLRGGASETIDLRPDPSAPRRPTAAAPAFGFDGEVENGFEVGDANRGSARQR